MRLEYKFVVHQEHLDNLRADILPFMEVDSHALQRHVPEYTVRSIYFDTLKMDFYREKVEGIRARKKVRIRGYNTATEESIVYLELKRKFENTILKDRSPLYFNNLSALLVSNDVDNYILNGKGHVGSLMNANKFLFHLKSKALRPVVLVVYEREAYYCKFNRNLRVTFDKKLRSKALPAPEELFTDNDLRYAFANCFVLEIKFHDGFPRWLQTIIERYGLIRSAVSKYTICVDSQKLARPSRIRNTLLI